MFFMFYANSMFQCLDQRRKAVNERSTLPNAKRMLLTSWTSQLGFSRTLLAAGRSGPPALSLSPRIPARVPNGVSETPDRGRSRSRTACPSPRPGRSGSPDSAGAGRGGLREPNWATVTPYTEPSSRCRDRRPARRPTSRPSPPRRRGWAALRFLERWGCWFSPEGSAGSCGRPTLGSRSVCPAAGWSGPWSVSCGSRVTFRRYWACSNPERASA